MRKKGKLFLISGPSGVGKGTLIERVLEHEELKLNISISMTTRVKRDYEVEGKDYYFVSKNEFLDLIKQKKMLEYSDHFENYYGTPKKFVKETLSKGKNVILEIEFNGARQIITKFPEVISIIFLPPNLVELENRVRNRGTENEEKTQIRLARAELEMAEKHIYKYLLINNNLDKSEKELVKIIKNEIAG